MMANWNKLNEQFDNLLDSMSPEDWQSWAKNREAKKVMRTSQMLLKAKLQEEKLLMSNTGGNNIVCQVNILSEQGFTTVSITGILPHINTQYAMAA